MLINLEKSAAAVNSLINTRTGNHLQKPLFTLDLMPNFCSVRLLGLTPETFYYSENQLKRRRIIRNIIRKQ